MEGLVSVIIPTYSRPKYLERAIKSVLNQTYNAIEVIVVDDNGNNFRMQEETMVVIEKFVDYPNFKYIKNKCNLGGAESRNKGVSLSKGQYISFLDDDDVYELNKINEQMTILLGNENLDVCYCGMKYLDSQGNHIGQRNIYLEGSEELISNHIFRPITGTPALLMKKSVFEKISGFDKLKRYQDANLVFKILAFNFKITCVQKELIKVYIHDEDRISTKGSWIHLERDYIKETLKYIQLLSYRNSQRLIDKYHILNCFCENKSIAIKLINLLKTVKMRIFIISNILGVINYIKKS